MSRMKEFATDLELKQERMLAIAQSHGMAAVVHGHRHIAVGIPWRHISGLNGVEIVLCKTFRQLGVALGY